MKRPTTALLTDPVKSKYKRIQVISKSSRYETKSDYNTVDLTTIEQERNDENKVVADFFYEPVEYATF